MTAPAGRKVAGYRYRLCDVDVPIAGGSTTKCVLPVGHDGECAPVMTDEARRRARAAIPKWCICGRSWPGTTEFNAGFCPDCVAERRKSARELRHELRRTRDAADTLAVLLERHLADDDEVREALAAYRRVRGPYNDAMGGTP